MEDEGLACAACRPAKRGNSVVTERKCYCYLHRVTVNSIEKS